MQNHIVDGRERYLYFRSGIPFWRIKTILKDIDESITGGNLFLFHVKRERKPVKQPMKISERLLTDRGLINVTRNVINQSFDNIV